jgi:hypothetical protein
MSKEFVLVEDSTGLECGEPFEAKNWEYAAEAVLEEMGYRLKEIDNE